MILRGIVVADGEWIGLVVFVIFVVFSLLSQAAARWKEVQREVARRGRANPPGPAPNRADPLEDEIAEFLRRAAERQKPAPAQPGPRPSPPPPLPEESRRPSRPSPAPPKPVLVAEPAAKESVAEHVDQRMRRPQFGTVGSGGLGREVAQADEKIEEHLREKFDHRVSRLAGEQVQPATAPAASVDAVPPTDRTTAPSAFDPASVAALLATPATLRQVILASEILRRPEERWTR